MDHYRPIPHGELVFLSSWGTDLDIVNSARISYHKYHHKIEEGDDKLIHFLLKNRHGTPFEIPMFKFRVKAPLTVFREWQRHRISSFNEVSGRYVELKQEAYTPSPEAMRKQVGKPGSYSYEPVDNYARVKAEKLLSYHYSTAFTGYKKLLALGIAKEVARNVLPQGLFSEMIYQANARSLMNFISLRSAPTAMYEIRMYAEKIEECFKKTLPITYEAFIKYGKVAP